MKKSLWLFACLIMTHWLIGQIPLNLDFEQICEDSKSGLCHWEKSWGADQCCFSKSKDGNRFLHMYGQTENAVGFIEQEIMLPVLADIRILEVSASIMTEGVIGKGAGINVGMYNADGELLATKDMGGFYSPKWIQHSTPWQRYSVKTICPVGTSVIKIGAILYGKGQANFDDFQFQLDDLSGRKPNRRSKKFVSNAVDLISANSIVRDSANFLMLKNKALMVAGKSKKDRDCHLAIEYLLESLRAYGDHHSFFMSTDEIDNWKNNADADGHVDFPKVTNIENVGYIEVPPFHGGNEKLMTRYAELLQSGLRDVYSKKLKGWIIDLRENTGGNMEPMITGLGPLLDTGKIGSLIDVHRNMEHWYYRNGTYFWEDEKGISVMEPFSIEFPLPIAVLTGPRTGSSGEIVAISFIGNSKTKSFGEPTWGLTTGNGEFDLPDGSRIYLASTNMVDRNGVIYDAQLVPDYQMEGAKTGNEDPVLKRAIQWLIE